MYLWSMARARLFDSVTMRKTTFNDANESIEMLMQPGLRSVRSCLKHNVWELGLSIFVIASSSTRRS